MEKNEKFEEEKKSLDPIYLEETIGKISYTLDRDYLSHLSTEYCVLNFDEYNKGDHSSDEGNYAGIRIRQFIRNKDEQIIDCLKNVVSAFSNSKDTLALLLSRTKDDVILDFIYKIEGNNVGNIVNSKIKLLEDAFKGNFPGSKIERDTKIKARFDNLFSEKKVKKNIIDGEDKKDENTEWGSVAVISSIPSDKSENYISQGFEKLINGVVPTRADKTDEYSVLILAQAMHHEDVRTIINGFEEMATTLTPFVTHQFQTGFSNSETNGEMKSATDTDGISHAITKTHSVNVGVNASISSSQTNGTSITKGESLNKPTTKSIILKPTLRIAGAVGVGALVIATGPAGIAAAPAVMGALKALDTAAKETKTITESITNFASSTVGKSLGMSAGYGRSWGTTDTTSSSKSLTDGTNHSVTISQSETATYTYKSYLVADLIEKLEENIKRITVNQATGMWKCATYVMSRDNATCNNVANFLRGITQGDESYIESAAVQIWDGTNKDEYPAVEQIYKYLSNFAHPIFLNMHDVLENIGQQLIEDDDYKSKVGIQKARKLADLIPVMPTTNISTAELSKLFSLPSHSLPNLPILECAEFGRNVTSYQKDKNKVNLGKIFHMHSNEALPVKLRKDSLNSHVFITGSTGSGKSNTVYQLIKELKNTENGFLIIEPAKGEYKNIFGDNDVTVFGTNPSLTKLLKINPFKFQNGNDDPKKNIHILEHLDRLIEIFNVCWPMYAAMPAVLKEAIEKAYIDAGWDLISSKNKYELPLYPTFEDVVRNIRMIIDSSEYDSQNKGAYKGSLITRLNSLCNGINGLLFTNKNDIDDEKLFDEKVIIDLSRIGSSETKSLIMGILVLRLQEYRMTHCNSTDATLKHFTVLEEAHHLLRNSSVAQSGEGNNLTAKSVEMLTNAIAEMRTYGEGFFIVDQAPGLLDMSVIRNTNTKIIMRLPDYNDRELVGRSANMNENQIEELAKLPTGVAAVYQNDWVQPVLCNVNELPKEEKNKEFKEKDLDILTDDSIKERLNLVKLLCLSPLNEAVKQSILKDLLKYNFSGTLYAMTNEYIENSVIKPDFNKLSVLVSRMIPELNVTIHSVAIQYPGDINVWRSEVQNQIERILQYSPEESDSLKKVLLQCIIQNYVINELNKPELIDSLIK